MQGGNEEVGGRGPNQSSTDKTNPELSPPLLLLSLASSSHYEFFLYLLYLPKNFWLIPGYEDAPVL
jgi:hypothetical protein